MVHKQDGGLEQSALTVTEAFSPLQRRTRERLHRRLNEISFRDFIFLLLSIFLDVFENMCITIYVHDQVTYCVLQFNRKLWIDQMRINSLYFPG